MDEWMRLRRWRCCAALTSSSVSGTGTPSVSVSAAAAVVRCAASCWTRRIFWSISCSVPAQRTHFFFSRTQSRINNQVSDLSDLIGIGKTKDKSDNHRRRGTFAAWGRAGGERARRMPIGCLEDPAKKLTKLQKAYTKVTFLTHDEVLRIDRLLDFLDQDGSGAVSSDELRRIPELVFNPFGDRIVRVMDIDGSNELSVVELMDLFSIFSHRATSRAKAQILFCMFDFDEDGELGPHCLPAITAFTASGTR
jgi:hypothetical protein